MIYCSYIKGGAGYGIAYIIGSSKVLSDSSCGGRDRCGVL